MCCIAGIIQYYETFKNTSKIFLIKISDNITFQFLLSIILRRQDIKKILNYKQNNLKDE